MTRRSNSFCLKIVTPKCPARDTRGSSSTSSAERPIPRPGGLRRHAAQEHDRTRHPAARRIDGRGVGVLPEEPRLAVLLAGGLRGGRALLVGPVAYLAALVVAARVLAPDAHQAALEAVLGRLRRGPRQPPTEHPEDAFSADGPRVEVGDDATRIS